VSIEHRHAGGQPDQLPGLAVELVRTRADVIFARGAGALLATRNATSTIPIVAVDLESDPVAKGFVKNLARPGGNVTGVFLDLPELSGKQLQLLREVSPTSLASRSLVILFSMPLSSSRRISQQRPWGSSFNGWRPELRPIWIGAWRRPSEEPPEPSFFCPRRSSSSTGPRSARWRPLGACPRCPCS
jgi:ABC transporter substrate binding protein